VYKHPFDYSLKSKKVKRLNMSFGKMREFIELISTSPIKDAEGFVTNGDTVLANLRAYKEEHRRHKIMGEPGGVLNRDGAVQVPARPRPHGGTFNGDRLWRRPIPHPQRRGRKGARDVLGMPLREDRAVRLKFGLLQLQSYGTMVQ
jgi:hypothetical protein